MNGKIYTLRSYSRPDLVYVGSTTQTLSARKKGHKRDYNCWLEGKTTFVSSFKIIELGDYYIELEEYFTCNSKEELNRREGEIIRQTNCVNKVVPGRTKKEYYEENKDKINKKHKKHYEKNKEKILEKNKKYNGENREKIAERQKGKITCECGRIVRKYGLPEHKRSKVHQKYIDLCWWT